MGDVTSAELFAEADGLIHRARVREQIAQDRYDAAAREQGFGTLMFFKYMDQVDADRKEARQLRELARRYRDTAIRVRDELGR
ncbi:hypothetical protein GII30_02595 [Gordonia amarae]|uniref:Uncharacterized protein n=2 Tax=Gordonia amarae TaxID=36821 RepID=G7GN47_9ACTN|nr:hypothetical protein [Gordonia amarae]MCS3877246.1 hypothetical protein [Gordonia amarae]QHN16002.1 hypothetical protein GII35_02500 [Gordonia amarae]QHN20571.1 hypothetical protein GII34_02500 [Gordonia amarae]QHN29422.1 hypothetical protein GII32_02505 [Gordonia amarae]QHN38216.1 hypothetical protein GII30_02595 [Gordonia amarae]